MDLRRADLRRAELQYTHLQGSNLHGANLRGARYNRRTVWPRGFDPRKHGAILAGGHR